MAKMSPAEKQKKYRERKALTKTTARIPGSVRLVEVDPPEPVSRHEFDRLWALVKAQEVRLQALEDSGGGNSLMTSDLAPPLATVPRLSSVPMNPAMQARMAQQPPKGVTRDGEVIPTPPRTFQGRPIRTCCQSVEGMPHSDLCAEIL